jgi:hypothetical protein
VCGPSGESRCRCSRSPPVGAGRRLQGDPSGALGWMHCSQPHPLLAVICSHRELQRGLFPPSDSCRGQSPIKGGNLLLLTSAGTFLTQVSEGARVGARVNVCHRFETLPRVIFGSAQRPSNLFMDKCSGGRHGWSPSHEDDWAPSREGLEGDVEIRLTGLGAKHCDDNLPHKGETSQRFSRDPHCDSQHGE